MAMMGQATGVSPEEPQEQASATDTCDKAKDTLTHKDARGGRSPKKKAKTKGTERESDGEGSSGESRTSSSRSASGSSTSSDEEPNDQEDEGENVYWILPEGYRTRVHASSGACAADGRMIPLCKREPFSWAAETGRGVRAAIATGRMRHAAC